MLLWLAIGSAGFFLIQWFAFQRLDLLINIGFRTGAVGGRGDFPIWYLCLELLFNLILVVVAIGRLHDIGKSGWWLAALAAAAIFGPMVGGVAALFMVLAAWLALLLWPGTLGPNRYGPDRHGWQSREHYEAQMQQLRDQRG